MALIDSKQLNPRLTGSFSLSGSLDIAKGDLTVSQGGDILLDEDQRIYFEADKQTWIESNGANLIRTVTNNNQMLLLDHQTGNRAVFGNGTKVFIGENNNALPSNTLEVDGTISGSGILSIGGNITGSATASFGHIIGDGSGITGILPSGINGQLGIFAKTGSIQSTQNDLEVTGSLNVQSAYTEAEPSSSTGITTNNITNGYPTSNAWGTGLDGSYFNNFNNTTHVSEILRFIAGAMSHSLDVSDAAPNTKTFSSIDTNENNLGSTDSINGYVPTNYSSIGNATLDYLVYKGWASVGSTIFNGISVYHDNASTYKIDFDSNSGGSTSFSSSVDTELYGLGGLSSGAANAFGVRVIATASFSDTGSVSSPNESSNTYTTQSFRDYTQSSFGTSDGLTLAKLVTAQPAVIPSAYQDGKFIDVGGTDMTGTLSRKYHASKTSMTSVSSSGYYRYHGLSVGIVSGSQTNYTFKSGTTKNRFWAPVDQIESDIGTNSLADVGTTHKNLTATSRSLSGVPYLLDSTFEVSTKITGLFNPMYAASTTLVDMSSTSVGFGSVSISGDTISTSGGSIQTSGKVFQSDGTTAVNSGVPRYNDIAIVTASVSYDSGNADNVSQTGLGDSSFQVQTKARNRNSSQSTLDTQTIKYHTAGEFGQPVASGSLALYGRAQGYDGGSLTGTSEAFSGEDFRIVLNNNITSFSGTAWTTSYDLTHLGNYDLQVKPGFLVDPGGTYRYWYVNNHGSGTYKYYVRRFQDGSTRTQMTVDVGKTLVNWNSTSDGVAVGLILKSGTSAGSNTSITNCRIYDPSATTDNLIESGISNDNHKNPFSSNVDLYGNTGGSVSSTNYTVPIRNADGMYLDSSDNELYVIIRYKGDPSPVTSISLGFS